MDRREKNLNQLNGVRNTTTNMKVNTQEVSQRKPEPVPPAQPVQPAQEQNPIPTLYWKSGITLDKETQTTLDNALYNLIQDESGKRHKIYFGKDNKQSFDYYSGNEVQKRTFAPYGSFIYLQNDEGKNVEDLQSYLNNGKTIYCYNPQQYEYIGHFKKTEKGISVSQSNKEPTQSQEQPKEQTNAKSQPTESTQTTQQTSSSEQLQEKEYELADYQSIEHIFNHLTHPMAMTSFPTLDKRQISHTIDIEETDYTKKQLYDACMGLILNNKDGDIKSYKDLKNPQLCYYKDGSKYLHFNGRVGDEYNVRIEGTCDNFKELLADLENSKKRKKQTISLTDFLNTLTNEISTFQDSVSTSSAMNSIAKMSSDTKDSSKPYETKSVKQNTQVSKIQQG